MSKRDEQFAGFGRALIMRMLDQRGSGYIDFNVDNPEAIDEYSAIVARAAYDLVEHTLGFVPQLMNVVPDAQHLRDVMPHVPDLPELPEEQGE
jgi:hypothetical protein